MNVSDDPRISNTSEGGYEQSVSNDPLSYLQMMTSDYQQATSTSPTKGGTTGDGSDVAAPGPILIPDDAVLTEGRRPSEEDLPPALQEILLRARSVYPSATLELLKYRRTLNDMVVMELDDGTPLPPAERLVALSVTTSIVMQGFSELEVHLLIGAWSGDISAPTM